MRQGHALARRCAPRTTALVVGAQCRWLSGRTPVWRQAGAKSDGDFVDIDMLSLGIPSLEDAMASGAVPAGNELSTAPGTSTHVLGVTRRTPVAEGTEFSRFNLPLETPRGDQPIPRPHSRAVFSPGEEAHLSEQALQQKGASAASNTTATNTTTSSTEGEEPEDVALAVANAIAKDCVADGEFSSMPSVDTSLPYDDEAFAETLLQMEVDGVIDEAWQDSRKAHIEDVKEVTEVLRSLKVRDICCIDVSGKTSNFDYMLFGTCEGPRHIHLAAWAAQEADSLKRVSKIPRRKTDELWEVVPIGRIVLNLMVESLRDDLTLERKWAVTKHMDPLQAANAPVSEGRNVRAHGLWTLTLNLQDLEDFEVDYCKDVLLRQV